VVSVASAGQVASTSAGVGELTWLLSCRAVARGFHYATFALQAFVWWRRLSVVIAEAVGSRWGHAAGDWCVYHLGIVHAMMVATEGDAELTREHAQLRRWIENYERQRGGRRSV